MEKNELRVGNWVIDIFYDTPIMITKYFFTEGNVNNIEPIELTEEILLKCGFKKIGHLYKIHLLNSLNLMFNSEHNGWHFDIYHNSSKVELQYLHQLQNLYWCLCGEELIVNL